MTMDREEIFRGLWQIRDRDLALTVSLLATRGIDVLKSPNEALTWCTERAETGDPKAQHVLAKLLWTGLAGTRDDQGAFRWCSRASDQGYLPATVMLAGFYSTGIGVRRDSAKSIDLLGAAAAAGSADAMSFLAVTYDSALGVERDVAKAIDLWRSAAQSGHAESQYHLGIKLTESASQDEASEGVRWLREAATQGLPSAHHALAHLYETGGAGLPADEVLAERHRAAAAALEREE